MNNNLIKCIQEFNSNIEKIEKDKKITWKNIVFLPILQYLEINSFITSKELEDLLKDNPKIKKLKFYPFSDFINAPNNIESYLSRLTDELYDFLPKNIDVQSINFLLYELLINIYKHSKFNNAYIQIDNRNNGKNIDICIIDDGIRITGSFTEAGIEFENDSESIYEAINGKTTDKEKYNLHGRGLNSSVRITTLGFEGEMLIASGEGVCIINENGVKSYLNKNKIHGTFIILRIHNKKIENIYEYLKYVKLNRITEVKNV